jgi:hypothetical protein
MFISIGPIILFLKENTANNEVEYDSRMHRIRLTN